MRMNRTFRHAAALLAAFALVAAGCKKGTTGPDLPYGVQLTAEFAAYDMVADRPNRFLLGLLTQDNQSVSYGTVHLAFAFVGTGEGGKPSHRFEATGTFVPVPGTLVPNGPVSQPHVVPAAESRGVYQAEGLRFPVVGFWQVTAGANVDGLGQATGKAAFQVLAHPAVPAVGDKALKTKNHVLGEAGVPAAAIDSRATEGPIPDKELHRTTIAAAIAAHRPAVVVFSTPTFCLSRFCGPITDVVQVFAKKYGDRAAFIHIEIWRDHQKNQVNKAAADWLLRNDDLQEPWVFLIGADGIIQDRWSNLLDATELEAALKKFPKS